jgi:glycosyltransferase involved in cell wall biosynthesis
MALGKPVVCYLRPDLVDLYSLYSWAKECPIVNTSPDQIEQNLAWLLDHKRERERLGREGKDFVEKHHSLKAMGATYDAIIRKVW